MRKREVMLKEAKKTPTNYLMFPIAKILVLILEVLLDIRDKESNND